MCTFFNLTPLKKEEVTLIMPGYIEATIQLIDNEINEIDNEVEQLDSTFPIAVTELLNEQADIIKDIQEGDLTAFKTKHIAILKKRKEDSLKKAKEKLLKLKHSLNLAIS